jgi:PAS domain S-box-containing protein
LASILSAVDVRYAALVDHDTIEGQAEFREALEREQIGFLSGVEISAHEGGETFHILGYGFDLEDAPLLQALQRLKKSGGADPLPVHEAIALLHAAGGRAFLAHPYCYRKEPSALEELCRRFKGMGLDGVEVFYSAYSRAEQETLARIAEEVGLLASAGTDLHHTVPGLLDDCHVDFPWEAWVAFRNAVGLTSSYQRRLPEKRGYVAWALGRMERRVKQESIRPDLRRFATRIFMPALLAIAIFVGAMWLLVLPTFETQLLARKRDMIRELTNSAWSVLAKYHADHRAGLLTVEEAQRRALSDIQAIRYGDEQKDYFWITDLVPNMLMHPYRLDLNGTDVSGFKDQNGKRVFVEFVRMVKARESGYVVYRWQWKDNADKIVPKESYVKLFRPWGWVIGTGIYIEDVAVEIARIERKLIVVSLVATIIIVLLMLYLLRQSLAIERQRSEAVGALRDSHERYRTLVEASSSGTMMVVEGRCLFSNRIFLEMLDYNEKEMAETPLAALFFSEEQGRAIEETVTGSGDEGVVLPTRLETRLKTRGGAALPVLLDVTRITVGGKPGFVFSVRESTGGPRGAYQESPDGERLLETLDFIRFGLVRTTAGRQMQILDGNLQGRKLLGLSRQEGHQKVDLLGFIRDDSAREAFVTVLREEGAAKTKIEFGAHTESRTVVMVDACQVTDERGDVLFCLATLEDVTGIERREEERERLLEELRHLTLPFVTDFGKLAKPLPVLDLETPCRQASALLLSSSCGVVLVSDARSSAVVGYVDEKIVLETMRDTSGKGGDRPLYEIMRAPLPRLPAHAAASEALGLLARSNAGIVVLDSPREHRWLGLREIDFFRQQTKPFVTFEEDFLRTDQLDSLRDLHGQHLGLLRYGFESGADPMTVMRLISWETDLVVLRVFDMVIKELGEPPVPFSFMALGSQGRSEQTFRTDQDNAIVFADVPREQLRDVNAYFQRLGDLVCSWMDEVGFPFCRGNVMAKNPRWVMPLSEWVKTFSGWIRVAEPQALLEFNMFFDFRSIHGDASLVSNLRSQIGSVMDETPTFFMHLAENALRYRPPLSFFGNIVLGENTDQPSSLNIKDAMLPITNFARIYALKGRLAETNTLQRLHALREAQILSPSTFSEISETYRHLAGLRLRHQSSLLRTGARANNFVEPGQLSSFDRVALKHALSEIATMLRKISFDFLGGTR